MSFTKRQLRTYYHKRHVTYKVEDLSHDALYEFPRSFELLVPINIYFCYQHFIIFIQRHMVCTYGFHRFQESYSVKAESCEAHVKHHG